MKHTDAAPLVSVHMITYNHAAWIGKAIDGVLRQHVHFPFELVIGEDCSTDGTREILYAYRDRHPDIIRILASETNIGARRNSYRTMKACRGRYIAFCEGDDHWHDRTKLGKQTDYLAAHPDCGLVFSSYDVFHGRTGRKIRDFIRYKGFQIPDAWDITRILDGLAICILTCTVAARRDLCERIVEADSFLHQEDHFLMGDTQLWAELSTVARLHYIPEPLATHNVTEESASRSKSIAKKLRFEASNAELFLYLSRKHNLPARLQHQFQQRWLDYSLRLALHTGSAELADMVLRTKGTLTGREWLRYCGAHNSLIRSVCTRIGSLNAALNKAPDKWL